MRDYQIDKDQLVWGAMFAGWLLGIFTMLLLGYSPENCHT